MTELEKLECVDTVEVILRRGGIPNDCIAETLDGTRFRLPLTGVEWSASAHEMGTAKLLLSGFRVKLVDES